MTQPDTNGSPPTLSIGGLPLILPKLTLGQLRRSQALVDAVQRLQSAGSVVTLGQMPAADVLTAMVDVVFAAAERGQSITRPEFDDVVDGLDLPGIKDLALAVATVMTGRTIRLGTPAGEEASPSS